MRRSLFFLACCSWLCLAGCGDSAPKQASIPTPSVEPPAPPAPIEPPPAAVEPPHEIEPPVPAPAVITWKTLELGACGLSLQYPSTFFIADEQKGKNPLRFVGIVQDDPVVHDLLEGRLAGERPLMMYVQTFAVKAKAFDLEAWFRKRAGEQEILSLKPANVAGHAALAFQINGQETLDEGVVLGCPERVIELSAHRLHGYQQQERTELARVITTLAPRGPSPEPCTPPGLPCEGPMLSLCIDGAWKCAEL